MKTIMVIFLIIVVIVELFIIAGCFTTAKYQIEMSTDFSNTLTLVYSLLNSLSLIILFYLI